MFLQSLNLVFAVQKGEFAAKLSDMLWTAYGPLIKFAGVVVLVFVVGIPVLGFIRRIFR